VNPDLAHPYLLTGRSLWLARLGWVVIALLVLAPTLISWGVYSSLLGQVCEECLVTPALVNTLTLMGIGLRWWAVWRLAITVLVGAGWIGAGIVIFSLRSNDRRAILISLLILLVGPGFGGIPAELALARPEWALIFRTYVYMAALGFISLAILFPNGKLSPRWSLWPLLYLMVLFFPNSFIHGSQYDFATWPMGLRIVLIFAVLLGVLIIIPLLRYRRYLSAVERQQVRWTLLGFVITALGITLTMFTAIIFLPCNPDTVQNAEAVLCNVVQDLGYGLSPMMIPVFIGVSILRSRLWDIDVIIRRTLIYSAVMLLLGLVYLGAVTILQDLFMAASGQSSPLSIVLSTLAIAALFSPLRRRVQAFIDRRFYRQRYNAEQVLAAFAEQARQETDLEALTEDLVEVVQETMRPEQVGIWLQTGERQMSGTGSSPGDR
jgi:hypothetical protein